jgi:large subunit ribosomal protein L3
MKFILGKKVGMTTIYDKSKGAINATLIECAPNKISLIRNEKRDGYNAIQVTVQKTKRKELKREFRVSKEESAEFKKGDEITLDKFEIDEKVGVSGTSKGKGFQGVMKRHNFHGSPASHGHRHDHRAPGSIGSAYPQHVIKGKKMAGRMGGERATTKNLKIVYIDKENNLIGLKGAVPGVNGRMIEIFVK